MAWTEVKDKQPYIDSGDFANSETFILRDALFSPEGQSYPLVYIRISPDYKHKFYKEPITGINISISFKSKEGAWWTDGGGDESLPLELVGRLQEMLTEAMYIISNKDKDNHNEK